MISEQAAFFSPVDMAIVMAVALVVFGPAKLPEVGRQLGQALRELKKLTSDLTDSINQESSTVRSAFDTTSPYTLKPGPVDVQPEHSSAVEGYNSKEPMGQSPMLESMPAAGLQVAEVSAPGQSAAAEVPLTATVQSKSGDVEV
jgi:TatA/E family protein of Tat protein translocase